MERDDSPDRNGGLGRGFDDSGSDAFFGAGGWFVCNEPMVLSGCRTARSHTGLWKIRMRPFDVSCVHLVVINACV